MIAGNDKELKLLAKASLEFSKKKLVPNREENDNFPHAPFFDDILKKMKILRLPENVAATKANKKKKPKDKSPKKKDK